MTLATSHDCHLPLNAPQQMANIPQCMANIVHVHVFAYTLYTYMSLYVHA